MAQRPALLRTRSSSRSSLESLAYAGRKKPPHASSSSGSRGSPSQSDEADTGTPFRDPQSTCTAQGSMVVYDDRIVIRWETESKACVHCIPKLEYATSRSAKKVHNSQYAFLKSGCGGDVGSNHNVEVRWRSTDVGSTYIRDEDGLNRFQTKIISVGSPRPRPIR